jgi:hypothetical protein
MHDDSTGRCHLIICIYSAAAAGSCSVCSLLATGASGLISEKAIRSLYWNRNPALVVNLGYACPRGFAKILYKKTPWSESASELYLSSDRHLSAK